MSDLLRVEALCKSFGTHQVLTDINCQVKKGEFISILGPSGCGKTTLLRTIAGLEAPSSGKIYHEGVDITEVRPDKRGFSIVFQDYALFPHMTLYDNVAYGLKLRKKSAQEIRDRVMSTLSTLKLEKAIKKLPSQLSGGMQQRAAIARSLVLDCDLLLLDEPFSALDAVVKVDLSEELKELQSELGITRRRPSRCLTASSSWTMGTSWPTPRPSISMKRREMPLSKPSLSTKSTSAHAISGI